MWLIIGELLLRTHELTIARDVLRTSRRIAAQLPGWALTADGLRNLRGHALSEASDGTNSATSNERVGAVVDAIGGGEGEGGDDGISIPGCRVCRHRRCAGPVGGRHRRSETAEAWNVFAGVAARPLARPAARSRGPAPVRVTTSAHLAAVNLGRQHRDRETRLRAIAHGLIGAAEIGLKEHDRLALARQMMERKILGRRVVETAGAGRADHRPSAGLGRHGRRNARSDAAGGASDCRRAWAARDYGEGRFRAWGVL